jgi:hypothetical protein
MTERSLAEIGHDAFLRLGFTTLRRLGFVSELHSLPELEGAASQLYSRSQRQICGARLVIARHNEWYVGHSL